uniref:major histocompatibility complex class I-related gene protein-like isoform X2 n=1 Tax=Pristiophorus japonicus TaxID=55135 RepID=UPI00398EBD27
MIGLIVLALLCGGVSTGSHSLRYFLTSMTPTPGLPEYVGVGYVDDVQFLMYDSDRQKLIPREQWMVESEGPESWKRKLQLISEREELLKVIIQILMARTNQSGGIHTYQEVTSCELQDDGTTSGSHQKGWDGRDYISFDKDHMVWVTPVSWGESVKNWKDQQRGTNQRWKRFLEQECIEWLKKYLQYGERLLRAIPPAVFFIRPGDAKRLSCVATGFYPQAIEVTLRREGMFLEETVSSGILPNHDSRYQINRWTEFDPEDQGRYSCEVEHGGLEEKVIVFYAGKENGYNAAKTSDKGESSSNAFVSA